MDINEIHAIIKQEEAVYNSYMKLLKEKGNLEEVKKLEEAWLSEKEERDKICSYQHIVEAKIIYGFSTEAEAVEYADALSDKLKYTESDSPDLLYLETTVKPGLRKEFPPPPLN